MPEYHFDLMIEISVPLLDGAGRNRVFKKKGNSIAVIIHSLDWFQGKWL